MKCPECEEEIDHVYVISECHQRGHLTENKITEYGSVTVGETLRILCPECMGEITEHVKEN